MPFLSQNVNIGRFWTNKFGLRGRRIFCWHFYAWRRGRILVMPAAEHHSYDDADANVDVDVDDDFEVDDDDQDNHHHSHFICPAV